MNIKENITISAELLDNSEDEIIIHMSLLGIPSRYASLVCRDSLETSDSIVFALLVLRDSKRNSTSTPIPKLPVGYEGALASSRRAVFLPIERPFQS